MYISTLSCTHQSRSRCFSVEASSTPYGVVSMGDVYLRNPVSGNQVKFNFHRTDRDTEGDALAWVYLIDQLDANAHNMHGYKLVIFND